MSLLEVKDLSIHYVTHKGTVRAVNNISFTIEKGETLGLVGETGAGKTTTALGLMSLVPDPPGRVVGGEIIFKGDNVLTKKDADLRKMRGNDISMIFQDPMTALNPILRIGDQISEVVSLHQNVSKSEADKISLHMLEMVGIPGERFTDYPHQFSGGMKQRVVIAMALACNPELLIADEPTTALDVTIQAQVLEMIGRLKTELNTAVLMITHDLGIVAECCDRVAVMYAGEIVEYGSLQDIFKNVQHPYTIGLFGSIPSLDKDVDRLTPIEGLMPDPANLPEGCSFCPRCPNASENCANYHPELVEVNPGHLVRCLRATKEGGADNE